MHAANVMLIGAPGVGKSTVIHRYLGGDFSDNYYPTDNVKAFIEVTEMVGYDVLLTLVDTPHGSDIKVDHTDIVVLMFALDNLESFEDAKKILKKLGEEDIPVVLVGNKRDLDIADEIKFEEITVPLIQITTKRNEDIAELFEMIGLELIRAHKDAQSWVQWWNGGDCLRCRFCRHCGRCYCCPWKLSN